MSNDIKPAVDAAVTWLRHQPRRDYLDAAYQIAVWARPVPEIAGKRWPEFVAAVKEAAQTLPLVT